MKRGELALIVRAAKVGAVVGLAGLLVFPVAAGASQRSEKADASVKLVGVFKITGGSCTSSGGVTSGSYFRMLEPGGATYVPNDSSPCGDTTYTPLLPGKSGGLSTKAYQPNPNPEFDSSGNGLAKKIFQPQGFEGLNFAVSTNATDPQTGDATKVPSISDKGGTLKGQIDAFSVGWNNQNFNQGSPKPAGASGTTSGPTGTYNPSTKAFVLQWSSEIDGGPFNGFTGEWYLVGTFSG
jgi:hypothetical protein